MGGATKEVKGNVLILGWQKGAAGGGRGGLEVELEQLRQQQEEQHCGDMQGLDDTTRGREWKTHGNWCGRIFILAPKQQVCVVHFTSGGSSALSSASNI